jgi:serine/threonine-protein kinase
MVRILTQDVDPLLTRKAELPPALTVVVDACLRRDRDQRINSAGAVAQQLERALNELRAVRYRSAGRRASDRAQGGFKRRATDAEPKAKNMQTVLANTPAPQKLLIAAGLGAVLGGCLVAILFLLTR